LARDEFLPGKYAYLLLFILGASLRSIPELIVEKYPVGYDTTAHYASTIPSFGNIGVVDALRTAPLFYVVMYFLVQALGVDVFRLLKLIGPLLYGSLAASFHFFLANSLGWRDKRSLIAALVFSLQLVTLRISWDMFRLELGLIFAFMMLGLASREAPRRKCLVTITSMLTVLAHQIATLIMFFSTVWLLLSKGKLSRKTLLKAVPLIPSAILFLIILYITFFIPPLQDPRIIGVGPKTPFLSYFKVDPRFLEGSYILIARNIGMLLIFCYGLILPFAVKGFEKHKVLNPILTILCVGSFSPLVIPFISLPVAYWRWIILLIIPFSAYAANGMIKFKRLWRRRAMGATLVFLFFSSLALGYASGTLPLRSIYFQLKGEKPQPSNPDHVSFDPIASVATYIPSSMVASPISVGDVTKGIDDTVASLEWLGRNAPENSCLLVEERFNGLARLYTPRSLTLAVYMAFYPAGMALQEAKAYNFKHIYLIWYSDVDVEGFKEIYSHGAIAIYEYEGA